MNSLSKTLFGIILSGLIISCSPSAPTGVQKASIESNKNEKPDVIQQYLQLKDALIASDANKAQKSAQILAKSLAITKGFETPSLSADSIAKSNDLAQQRSLFTHLSEGFIVQVKKGKLVKSLYVQYCPMANQGAGGYWLAAEKEVRNPYYGDEMLNCGEVKETLK